MRNTFYPRRQARYIVGDELKELKQSGTKYERDHGFGVEIVEDQKAKQKAELNALTEDMSQKMAEIAAQRQGALEKRKEEQERAKEIVSGRENLYVPWIANAI